MTEFIGYIPRKRTARRYCVHIRTVSRWERDPKMRFPKPLVLNGRKYDELSKLLEWEQRHWSRLHSIALRNDPELAEREWQRLERELQLDNAEVPHEAS